MKDEIKKILENVKKCCDITKDQSFTVYQRQDILALLDYITNLQEENERLKENMKIKDNTILINYNKDTKEYTLDRKNYYKINKRLNERLDYKSRNEKAVEFIKENDGYAISRNYYDNKLLNILNGGDKNV